MFCILYSKALSRFVYPLNEFTYAELNPDHLRKVLTLSERVECVLVEGGVGGLGGMLWEIASKINKITWDKHLNFSKLT